MPTVTKFSGKSDLPNGKVGLHMSNGRKSATEISGSGLTVGMAVTATLLPRSPIHPENDVVWTGELDSQRGDAFLAELTCRNVFSRGTGGGSNEGGAVGLGEGGGEGEGIAVTVGGSPEYTPPSTDLPPTGP